MSLAKNVIGAVVVVIIGGSAYTVSQNAIVDNLADDTGMTHQEAELYVEKTKDNLVSWNEIGDALIEDGESALNTVADIDCDNYYYEWESSTITCASGKAKLYEIGNDEISLGEAYKKLTLESASKKDIPPVIELIDKVNQDYDSEIIKKLIDHEFIDELKKTNSYNKATLKAILQGD